MKLISVFLSMAFIVNCLAQSNLTERQKNYNNRASSEQWQPDKVIETLNIRKGWTIGDLGTGGGYYSFRFAEETGKEGKVFAADISERFLIGIKKEAENRGLENIDTIHSSEDDSHFDDKALDLIFIRNTFHHLKNRNQYMKQLTKKLKPGGEIAIIDYKSQMSTYPGHNVSKDEIMSAIQNTGLIIKTEFDFIERQHFLILRLQE